MQLRNLSLILALWLSTGLMAQPPIPVESTNKSDEKKSDVEYVYIGGCIKYIESTKKDSK